MFISQDEAPHTGRRRYAPTRRGPEACCAFTDNATSTGHTCSRNYE